MPDWAIIADDLTGALDAAAPFAMRGISTAIALDVSALEAVLESGAQVVGVSTDSREVSPSEARERVRQAVAAVPDGTPIFKKIDSRLKGNIEAELDAIPHRQSLVVPAIPAFGRWTRNGALGGFGVTKPIEIGERIGRHHAQASIPDIETEDDIDLALAQEFDLPIGARSLAEALAARMSPNTPLTSPRPAITSAYCVIGSTDPITLTQLAALRASRSDLIEIAAPNGVGPAALPARPGGLTILQATPGFSPASGEDVAEALADTLTRLQPSPGALLVLSGGATAQVILGRLGISALNVLGEALPGLPVSRAGGLTVVTKSGGFGSPETLEKLFSSDARFWSFDHTHVG